MQVIQVWVSILKTTLKIILSYTGFETFETLSGQIFIFSVRKLVSIIAIDHYDLKQMGIFSSIANCKYTLKIESIRKN